MKSKQSCDLIELMSKISETNTQLAQCADWSSMYKEENRQKKAFAFALLALRKEVENRFGVHFSLPYESDSNEPPP